MEDQESPIEEQTPRPEWLWAKDWAGLLWDNYRYEEVRAYIGNLEIKYKRLVADVIFAQESLDARESYISELEKERNYWMDRAEANSENVR